MSKASSSVAQVGHEGRQHLPRVPRLGRTTTAPENGIRAPASHQLGVAATTAGVQCQGLLTLARAGNISLGVPTETIAVIKHINTRLKTDPRCTHELALRKE